MMNVIGTAKVAWHDCKNCTRRFRSNVHNAARCPGCKEAHAERRKHRLVIERHQQAKHDAQIALDTAILQYAHIVEIQPPYSNGYWRRVSDLTNEIARLKRKRSKYG